MRLLASLIMTVLSVPVVASGNGKGACISECNCRPTGQAIATCNMFGNFGLANLGACISFLQTAEDVTFGGLGVPLSLADIKTLCLACECDEVSDIQGLCEDLGNPEGCLLQDPVELCAFVDNEDDPEAPMAPCEQP